jgi:hypothetical protein
MDSLVWLFEIMGISILEFLDSDTDEILLRALCMDITGRAISARNCYREEVAGFIRFSSSCFLCSACL